MKRKMSKRRSSSSNAKIVRTGRKTRASRKEPKKFYRGGYVA